MKQDNLDNFIFILNCITVGFLIAGYIISENNYRNMEKLIETSWYYKSKKVKSTYSDYFVEDAKCYKLNPDGSRTEMVERNQQ